MLRLVSQAAESFEIQLMADFIQDAPLRSLSPGELEDWLCSLNLKGNYHHPAVLTGWTRVSGPFSALAGC